MRAFGRRAGARPHDPSARPDDPAAAASACGDHPATSDQPASNLAGLSATAVLDGAADSSSPVFVAHAGSRATNQRITVNCSASDLGNTEAASSAWQPQPQPALPFRRFDHATFSHAPPHGTAEPAQVLDGPAHRSSPVVMAHAGSRAATQRIAASCSSSNIAKPEATSSSWPPQSPPELPFRKSDHAPFPWAPPHGSVEPSQVSNDRAHLMVTLEVPSGRSFAVCPCMPFRIESSFHVIVGEARLAQENMTQVQLTGVWKRVPVGAALQAEAATVMVTLVADSMFGGVPRVVAAQGPGRFARCAREHWLLAAVGGVPVTSNGWPNQLVAGTPLVLRRPPDVSFILRKPDLQVPRLLAELAEEHGSPNQTLGSACGASRLLAAPSGGGTGVAVLAAVGAKGDPLLPPIVLEELEERFGVVFAEPDHCADIVLAECAPEGLLCQLLAFGSAAALHRRGWIFVETPLRLCLSDVLAGQGPRRSNVRVPSVDVVCEEVRCESGKLVAHIFLRPAVRVAQPLDGFLAIDENRMPNAPYAADGTIVRHQPPVHVLPQLTMATMTHMYFEGLSTATDLPADLRTEGAFADYWRLVHGYRLPPAALGGFARVMFQQANFSLTYPLACLWRHPWALQPMMSRAHAPRILQLVMLSLKQSDLLGGPQHMQLLEAGVTLAPHPEVLIEKNQAPPPSLLPASRAHHHKFDTAVKPQCEQDASEAQDIATNAVSQVPRVCLQEQSNFESTDGPLAKRRRLLLPLLK